MCYVNFLTNSASEINDAPSPYIKHLAAVYDGQSSSNSIDTVQSPYNAMFGVHRNCVISEPCFKRNNFTEKLKENDQLTVMPLSAQA